MTSLTVSTNQKRALPGGVRTVGGVDAGGETPCHDTGHRADVPLGRVEAQDVDGVERLQTKLTNRKAVLGAVDQ